MVVPQAGVGPEGFKDTFSFLSLTLSLAYSFTSAVSEDFGLLSHETINVVNPPIKRRLKIVDFDFIIIGLALKIDDNFFIFDIKAKLCNNYIYLLHNFLNKL